jgi:prepilin-type N-terminal cleavage/methylation domain-containing protein
LAFLHLHGSHGFTLVELLVSIAVLSLIVLMVSQMVNNAASIVSNSGKHMDMDTEARVTFNRLEIELASMVKRPEVDYSAFKQPASTLPAQYGAMTGPANLQTGGNDQLAFYSETTGYTTSTALTGASRANLSLVAYQVANDPYAKTTMPVLRRMSQAMGWEPGTSSTWVGVAYLPVTISQQWGNLFGTASAYAASYETVGDQVFRMEYTYLLKPTASLPARYSITPWDTTANPAHTSINGFQDVAAIVLTLALLDARSRAIVHDYSRLIDNSIFTDAADGSSDTVYQGDVARAWNAAVNSSTFATASGVPPSAASAVRIYERSFPLDTSP